MKKIYSLAIAAIATLSAISCTQELDKVEVADNAGIFTAYADRADATKTVKAGKESHWQSGDRIWILNGKEGDYGWKKAYVTSDSNSNKASFTEEDNSYSLEGDKYFAVYPAASADHATWEGTDIMGVELKANQQAVAGSFDPAAHIAVAQSDNQTLSFKNAVSLVKFQVKNEGVKSVTIYSKGGEKITGKCNISAEGNVTPWTGENEANGWVELSAGDGTFVVGKDYYISVFPSVLAGGLGIEFSFGGNKILVKSHEAEVTFKRNGIINVGELEYVAPTTEGFVPEEGWAYVKVNANWKSDNARFAAYFFGNGEEWANLEPVEGQTDLYGCQIPEGFVNIIFCRMNPAFNDNNWSNTNENRVWTQTADLKLTEGCLYTINEGSWNDGTWSGNPAVQPDPNQPESELTSCKLIIKVNKAIDWYDKYIYAWYDLAGTETKLCGEWPGTKAEWDKEEGDYYIYYHNFNASLNGTTINYIINGNGGGQTKNLSVTLNGDTTTVTIEASDRI